MNVRPQLRSALGVTLSLSLAFPPALISQYAHARDTRIAYDVDVVQDVLARASAITARRSLVFDEAIDLYANGDQEVNVYDGHEHPVNTIDLNRLSTRRQQPAFSDLEPAISAHGTLLFRGLSGADKSGQNAMLVATHELKRVRDIVAVTADPWIVYAIDQHGSLHVGDFGRITTGVFTESLFMDLDVVKSRVWDKIPKNAKIELRVMSLGTTLRREDLHPDAIIPLDARGNPVFTMGDLQLMVDGRVMEVFARKASLKAIERGQIYLLSQARAKLAEDGELAEAETLKSEQDAEMNSFAAKIERAGQAAIDPVITSAVEVMGKSGVKALADRLEKVKGVLKRPQETLDIDRLIALNQQIVATAQREEPAIKLTDIESRWPEFINRDVKSSSKRSVREDWLIQKKGWSPEAARERASKEAYYLKLARAAAIVVPFMLAPMAFERTPWLQQFQATNWIYAHYPDVLKEASYRLVMFQSIFWMTALWPAVVATSFATGQLFARTRDVLDLSQARRSKVVRDFARRWSEGDSWSRLVDFGYRYYAKFILGPGMLIVDKAMRQPVMVEAFEKRMNPLTRVSKDSVEGRAAGLTQDASLAVVPARGKERAQYIELKRTLLAETLRTKRRLNDHIHLLAVMAAAQEFGVPQELIEMFKDETSVTPAMVERVLTDPKQRTAARRIHLELAREISHLPLTLATSSANEELDANALLDHFRKAEAAAQKIVNADPIRHVINVVRLEGRRASTFLLDHAAEAFWSWGKSQAEFLSQVRTNKFLSDMVRRGFVIDHLLMVFLIALVGARANLSLPAQLAASATGFLMTSAQHWSDMFMNTYQHFFSVSSRTALNELKPQARDADHLRPSWDYTHKYPERHGGNVDYVYPTKTHAGGRVGAFFADNARALFGLESKSDSTLRDPSVTEESFGQGLKHVLADLVSGDLDLGGDMQKLVKTQSALFFGYFTMNLAFRYFFGGQNMTDATLGGAIQFASQFFYLYTWWLPAMAINRLSRARMAKISQAFDQARSKLIQGLETESNPEAALRLRAEGVFEMHELFQKRNPDVVDEAFAKNLSSKPEREVAEYYLHLANTESPGAMTPNKLLPWIAFTIAAFGSTWAGVTPSAASFSPENLNLLGVGRWLLWDISLTSGVILLLKKAHIVYARQKIGAAATVVREKVIDPCSRLLTR